MVYAAAWVLPLDDAVYAGLSPAAEKAPRRPWWRRRGVVADAADEPLALPLEVPAAGSYSSREFAGPYSASCGG